MLESDKEEDLLFCKPTDGRDMPLEVFNWNKVGELHCTLHWWNPVNVWTAGLLALV